MTFDPQAFISASSAIPSPGMGETPTQPAQAAATKSPKGFDPQRFINGGHATDQTTGSKIPLAFSGNSPETAMNKSILSNTVRMNLAMGNLAGNIKSLKETYGEDGVQPIKDNNGKPTDELAILNKGTWYRVNPSKGDISDPWHLAKEYATDSATYSRLLPAALGVAVGAGTAILTGGMSAPASAAIAGATAAVARTSLGRIVGTYEASPGEQAWDIGFESLLNAAGTKVLMGVKPTAKWVADKLNPLAEAFKDTVEPASGAWSGTSNPAKILFKKFLTAVSVSEREFDTMAENPKSVSDTMKSLYEQVGREKFKYHDTAIANQTDEIAGAAGDTRAVLSKIYGKMRNEILGKVPDNFSVNLEDPVYAAYSDAVEKGIGALKVGGKELTGKDAMDYMAKNGMKNTGFRMFNQDEMKRAIGQGADLNSGLGFLSANKDAHGVLQEFYSNLEGFTGGQNRTGVEGAKALLDFKKVATDLASSARGSEQAKGIAEIGHIIGSAKSAMDNQMYQSLKNAGLGTEFTQLNSTYNNLSNGLAPLLQAQKRSLNSNTGNKVFEPLLNSFLNRPSPSNTARGAIDTAIDAAKAHGLDDLALQLAARKNRIMVLEAAKAFNPIKSSELKSSAIQNLAQTLQQPAVAKAALATVQGLAKGQEWLTSQSKTGLDAFLSSPKAMATFTNAMVQAPIVHEQASQAAQQYVQQTLQKAQGQ